MGNRNNKIYNNENHCETETNRKTIKISQDHRCNLKRLTETPKSEMKSNKNERIISNRIVIVSLLGLYETWNNIPFEILEDAIFCLPLKKKWFDENGKHLEDNILVQRKMIDNEPFLFLLRYKDSQGLGFWMLDNYSTYFNCHSHNSNNKNAMKTVTVSPFWKYFSHCITHLYDPVTERNYSPLILDCNWWKTWYYNHLDTSQYDATPQEVIDEIIHVRMKFRAIMELLIHSNPSLIIFKCFNNEEIRALTCLKHVVTRSIKWNNWSDDSNDDNSYWISQEYDPYDLS